MNVFYPLENPIKMYDWGSIDGIADFTGISNPQNKPIAEMWMGANPDFSSLIRTDIESDPISLSQFISEQSELFLGTSCYARFGATLPFLFKILSIARPLSLQIHPSKIQARLGFARENQAGIPLSAPERNYKDENHKPEIILALTQLTVMCGFRNAELSGDLLQILETPLLSAGISQVRNNRDYSKLMKDLFGLTTKQKRDLLDSVKEKARTGLEGASDTFINAYNLFQRLNETYTSDIGVLAPFYLNVLSLKAGEALYVPHGLLHTYIEGTGLELMANSDNVLRGGLTSKHMDIPELLSVLNPHPYEPQILTDRTEPGMYTYPTQAQDFELSSLKISDTPFDMILNVPAIIIGFSGEIRLNDSRQESCQLTRGQSVFVRPTGDRIRFTGPGSCYIASLPDRGTKQ